MGDPSDIKAGDADPKTYSWRAWIVAHWRGELGLGVSYWLNGILCNAAVFGVVWLAGRLGVDGPGWPGIFRLAVWVFFVAAEAWFAVGVWRAAGRYAGPRFWAYAARLVVGLCFLLILWRIVPPGLPDLPKPLL